METNTLYDAVALHARRRPDAVALRAAAGAVSYADLHRLAGRAASGLRAQGIRAGDVIAAQLPNTLPFVVVLLAAGALGASVQMLHMPYRRAELATLLRHGGARCFVGLPRFKEESPLATVAGLDLGQRLVAAEALAPAGDTSPDGSELPDGAISWTSLLDAGDDGAAFAATDAASRYVLLHTSGTTAEPKGVPVSHRQFLGNAAASIGPLQVGPDDVLLPAAPMTHLYGLFVLEMALLSGAGVSLLPAFTPDALLATLDRDQVTAVFAGPAHFRPLLGMPDRQTAGALRSVRLVCLSGTAVAPSLAEAVEARLPRGKVIQLWGMSELQAGAYGRPADPADVRHQTAGRPSPGTELRVVGDDGTPVSGPGRLQMRGPSLFEGYLDNPAATAAAFQGGWFDTGDLACLREDGALVLTGRVKEIINRGGVKFNPADVEAVIDRLPGVVRSAVVPMPDPVLGEKACAFVEAQAPVTLAQLTAALDAAGIARFKWPERLQVVEQMPMTPTQKIMRGRLAALLDKPGEAGR
jgi:cyclohexanecarboxylate-CoA ligase